MIVARITMKEVDAITFLHVKSHKVVDGCLRILFGEKDVAYIPLAEMYICVTSESTDELKASV